MASAPNILLVDSDPDDVRMVREVVESAGLDLHVSSDRDSAVDAIQAIHPDLVLVRAQAREIEADDVARALRRGGGSSSTPIILIHDGAIPGWSSADSGMPPRQLLKPLGAPALLSLLAHYFPSAFLPPAPDSGVHAALSGPVPVMPLGTRAGVSLHDSLGAESFEDGPLGDLLDMVFPVEDSGDLAASLAEGRTFMAEAAGRTAAKTGGEVRQAPEAPPARRQETLAATRGADRTWPPVHSVPVSNVRETPPHPAHSVPVSAASAAPTQAHSAPVKAPPGDQQGHGRSDVRKDAPAAVAPPPGSRTAATSHLGRGDFQPIQVAEAAGAAPVLSVQPAADAVNPTAESRTRADRRDPHHASRVRPVHHARAHSARRWLILVGLGVGAAAATFAITRWIAGGETDLKPSIPPSRKGHRSPAPSSLAEPPVAEASVPSLSAGAIDAEKPLLPEEISVTPQAGSSRSEPPPLVTPTTRQVQPPSSRQERAERGRRPAATVVPAPVPEAPRVPSIRTESSRPEVVPAAEAARGAITETAPDPTPAAPGSGRSVEQADEEPAVADEQAHPADPPPARKLADRPSAAQAPPAQEPGGAAAQGNAADRASSSDGAAAPATGAAVPPASGAPAPPATELPLLAPVPISRPQPRYPPSARGSKLAGSVRLLVRVAEDGSVSVARVVGSVAPALDQAAVRAALEWKYRPAQFGDRTVSAWVEESIAFKP